MRKPDHQQPRLFYSFCLDGLIPEDHPLRAIKRMVEDSLKALDEQFARMYSSFGRPGIPPERLLKGLLLQILFTIRSERALMEHIRFNLLYRWFVGLDLQDPVWDPSTFSKNRDRLIEADIAVAFLEKVVAKAKEEGLLSDTHFSVDGTLLEAWASLKSFRPKDTPPSEDPPVQQGRNEEVDFHGEKRSNDTHASTTDPEAKLAKKGKGKEAKLSYTGHVLMENRNGLAVDTEVTQATGTCEREAAMGMIEDIPGNARATVGADKAYDTRDFVEQCRTNNVVPHVAQKKNSAIDARTTRHDGYAVSLRKRKRIEEIFGWLKTVGCLRKIRHRGVDRVRWVFIFAIAAYNLVRMRNLGISAA
jgi:transposase